jgi:hypothetical protein
MKIIDTFLGDRVAWYRKWTESTSSSPVHLALFGLFVAMAFTVVYARVAELAVLSEEQNVAVATLGKRPQLDRFTATIPEATLHRVSRMNAAVR